MKFTLREIIFTLITAAIVFALAIYIYPYFFKWAVPSVSGAIYNVTQFNTPFEQARLFATICAFVPVTCLFLWKAMPGIIFRKRVISALMIVFFMGISILLRRYFLAQELSAITKRTQQFPSQTGFGSTFENLNFEYWLTIGLLGGCILSFLFFRTKKKK